MSSDGEVAFGNVAFPVADSEEFEEPDVESGFDAGESGVGPETLTKGLPDALGLLPGTLCGSHDCGLTVRVHKQEISKCWVSLGSWE